VIFINWCALKIKFEVLTLVVFAVLFSVVSMFPNVCVWGVKPFSVDYYGFPFAWLLVNNVSGDILEFSLVGLAMDFGFWVAISMIIAYAVTRSEQSAVFGVVVKDYFLVRGSVATAGTACLLSSFVAFVWGLDFQAYLVNTILTTLVVVVFFFLLNLGLDFSKLFGQIDNDFKLLVAVTLCTFVSVELFNVFLSLTQGTSYFTMLFLGNFVRNKLVNLGASAIVNLIVRLLLTKTPLKWT